MKFLQNVKGELESLVWREDIILYIPKDQDLLLISLELNLSHYCKINVLHLPRCTENQHIRNLNDEL